jgi:hypothetical protein
MELSMGVRREVTNKIAAAYRRGSRSEKTAILDLLCGLTCLNHIWELDRGYTNLLLTQQKLMAGPVSAPRS